MKYCFQLSIFIYYIVFAIPISAQVVVPEPGTLFSDDVLPRIDIIITASALKKLYSQGNEENNFHHHATFIFNNGSVKDTLKDVGFRFRGNTSRRAHKKSFKISFNTYKSGRKYKGVEKMNLNGEHSDPTVMRSKICWDLLRDFGLPATRANHVQLYINGDYYGLYVNVEHIDENYIKLRYGNKDGNLYKCLWPADLDYKGANPSLYKEQRGDRRTYDLRTNREADDYSDLAHFIDILNNIPIGDLACELEKIFNIDDYLKYLAINISTGNWDNYSYNQNNFYLYNNTATGKFEYIPYDFDNTLGIDWLNQDWGKREIYRWARYNTIRPLYWRIMEVEEYRDRFSYYFNSFQTDIFNEEQLFPKIDELKNLIDSAILNDTYRVLDYGFSYEDFINSFDESLNHSHTPYGLKPFISTRYFSTNKQLKLNTIHPVIRNIQNNHPTQNQDISISVKIENDGIIADRQVCYTINNESPITCLPLFDDGKHNDGLANDGIYGIIISAIESAQTINYYIEATDAGGLSSRQPRCSKQQIIIKPNTFPLYINEFMASNSNTITDEAGEYDDWIELFNKGTEALYLGDKYLSDNKNKPKKWLMPDIWIESGQYLLFWADKEEEQGEMHTNFKLSASGEFIGIFDSKDNNLAIIDGIDFGIQQTDLAFGRIPDGTGVFQSVISTPSTSNQLLNTSQTILDDDIFLVYPNPFINYLVVVCPKENSNQWTAQFIDSLGKILLTQKLVVGENAISFKGLSLAKNIYYLRIIDKKGTIRSFKVLNNK